MRILQRILIALLPMILAWVQRRLSGSNRSSQHHDRSHHDPDNEVQQTISGQVRHIVDGDSLYIEGYKTQIRLWGVDAPELDEEGYARAKQQLHDYAFGEDIVCDVVAVDKYNRLLGRCFFNDGTELNQLMIQSGAAKEYMRFTKGYYSQS